MEEAARAFAPHAVPTVTYWQMSHSQGYLGQARDNANLTTTDVWRVSKLESYTTIRELRLLLNWLHSDVSREALDTSVNKFTLTLEQHLREATPAIIRVERISRLVTKYHLDPTKKLSNAKFLQKARESITGAIATATRNADQLFITSPQAVRTRALGPSESYEFWKLMFKCFVKGREALGIPPTISRARMARSPKKKLAEVWRQRMDTRFPDGYQPGDVISVESMTSKIFHATKDNPCISWTKTGALGGALTAVPLKFFQQQLDDAIECGDLDKDDLDSHVEYLLNLPPYEIPNPDGVKKRGK